jgi:hypothetical protein
MIQSKLTAIRFGVLLCGGLLVPSLPAAEAILASAVPEGQTEELHPFTHLAYIPANAEIGTIHFEGIRRVNVPDQAHRQRELLCRPCSQ